MSVRMWTGADEEQARHLGFRLHTSKWKDGTVSIAMPEQYSWFRSTYNAQYIVDLYVWALAEAGEPTACKALDVIAQDSPQALRALVRTVMVFTGRELADERWRYEK